MSTARVSRGVTETDVWKAADVLLLEGARPTIERVRNKIGRGSPNTVSPHLETWFRSLGARIVDPQAFSAPPALPNPITQAATHFWEAAMAAARNEAVTHLADERAVLAKAEHDLVSQRIQLEATEEKLMAQAEARDEALDVMRMQLAERVERLNQALAGIEIRDGVISQLRIQVAKLLEDRELSRRQWDEERSSYESDRRDLAAKEAAHSSHWAMEVDRAREALKSIQEQRAKAEKELANRAHELSARLEDSEQKAQRNADLYARTQAEFEKLQLMHAATENSLQELRHRLHDQEKQWAEQAGLLQTQLSNTLTQLVAKDQEQGILLRSLVDKSVLPPARRSFRRPRDSS